MDWLPAERIGAVDGRLFFWAPVRARCRGRATAAMHVLLACVYSLSRCSGPRSTDVLAVSPSPPSRERVAAEEQQRLFGGEQPLLAGEELGFDVTSLTGAPQGTPSAGMPCMGASASDAAAADLVGCLAIALCSGASQRVCRGAGAGLQCSLWRCPLPHPGCAVWETEESDKSLASWRKLTG